MLLLQVVYSTQILLLVSVDMLVWWLTRYGLQYTDTDISVCIDMLVN